MNFIKKAIGSLYLRVRGIGLRLEADRYKSSLLKCGENVYIGNGCKLTPSNISVGNNVVIGDGACFMATLSNIYIGNNVVFAPGVIIRGGDHRIDLIGKHIIEITESEKLPENDVDVYIGDGAWIGQSAIILKGVHIGEGAVVGAGSIVTKDVPPYTIHIGVHTTAQYPRFTDEQIAKHKELLEQNKQHNTSEEIK